MMIDVTQNQHFLDMKCPHRGWCPRGRLACDGPIPAKFQLKETESAGYRQRTRRNVQDSDATLIINVGPLDGGTALTLEFVRKLRKPSLLVQLDETTLEESIAKVRAWLSVLGLKTLNVAGPREEKRPSIFEQTRLLLWAVSHMDKCDSIIKPTSLNL